MLSRRGHFHSHSNMHYHDQRKALIKKKISAWNKEKRINTLGPGIARW